MRTRFLQGTKQKNNIMDKLVIKEEKTDKQQGPCLGWTHWKQHSKIPYP